MKRASPIFLKPLILRVLRARKIKGFRKIGENNEKVSVQDKNLVTQVLHNAKPELQGFCPVPSEKVCIGWLRYDSWQIRSRSTNLILP